MHIDLRKNFAHGKASVFVAVQTELLANELVQGSFALKRKLPGPTPTAAQRVAS